MKNEIFQNYNRRKKKESPGALDKFSAAKIVTSTSVLLQLFCYNLRNGNK